MAYRKIQQSDIVVGTSIEKIFGEAIYKLNITSVKFNRVDFNVVGAPITATSSYYSDSKNYPLVDLVFCLNFENWGIYVPFDPNIVDESFGGDNSGGIPSGNVDETFGGGDGTDTTGDSGLNTGGSGDVIIGA